MRILVTGGAGFVGAHLALAFKSHYPNATGVALDNLKRRGSELNLPRLRAGDVQFVHGDIRNLSDLEAVGAVDLIVECSAEPSVHAGYNESQAYLVQTNLIGTVNALENRKHKATFMFVHKPCVPIADIRHLPFQLADQRLDIPANRVGFGLVERGDFRALSIGWDSLIVGPQMASGASDRRICRKCMGSKPSSTAVASSLDHGKWERSIRGFVVLWAARHFWSGKLSYMGFGGQGHQVRDMLHVQDLFELLIRQLEQGTQQLVYNVGGGLNGHCHFVRPVRSVQNSQAHP